MSNVDKILNFNSKYSKSDKDLEVFVSTKQKTETLKVPKFVPTPDKIVNKSVILYGESGTGKTQIIRDIMYINKDEFTDGVVFCPTNQENEDYAGYFPDPLIFEDFGLEDITNIYNRQQERSKRYKAANNRIKLKELFDIIKTDKEDGYHRMIKKKYDNEISKIENITSDWERKNAREDWEKRMNNEYVNFYKHYITKNTPTINIYNDHQQRIYMDLYMNPRTLVIFDDAMEEIKTLIKLGNKENNQVVKNFFFKGRHLHITHIYTFQSDLKLDKGIKDNAFFSIFTTPDSAKGFFNKANMCKSLHDKKRVEGCADEIFGDDEKKYRVMVYDRKNFKNPFCHFKADLHDNFKMCGEGTWDFCKVIEKEDF